MTDDPNETPEITNDESDLDLLVRRLDAGYARIEDAQNAGQDLADWEEFWIDLMHQYDRAMEYLP